MATSDHMPGQDYLDRFWQSAKELPQFRDHPLVQERSLSRLVALSIHGDETPVLSKGKIWSSSALIFSWTSLLSNIFALGTSWSMACRWVARHSGGQLWRLGLHVAVSGASKVEFKFPLLLVPVSETGSQ